MLGANGSFNTTSGDAKFYGFELETAWRLIKAWNLYGVLDLGTPRLHSVKLTTKF